MERLLAGRYRAVWGFAVRHKERAVTGGLGPSGLKWDESREEGRPEDSGVYLWTCILVVYEQALTG